jgi:hypothetical protein
MSGVWLPEGANRGLPRPEGGWRRRSDLERDLHPGVEPGTRAYERGECRVLLSRHPDTRRWHLSISCADRDPTWDEIRDARYSLLPDRKLIAMLLPPRAEYVNVHPHTFHLHEVSPEEAR